LLALAVAGLLDGPSMRSAGAWGLPPRTTIATKPKETIVSASGEPIRVEGDPKSSSTLGPSVSQRQAPGWSGADIRPVHSRLNQLLQPLLQISSPLHIEADRRPSVTLGSAQVQTPEAMTEACANLAGPSGQTNARAL